MLVGLSTNTEPTSQANLIGNNTKGEHHILYANECDDDTTSVNSRSVVMCTTV